MENVKKKILVTLRKNYDRDLNNTTDRRALAKALDEVVNSELNRELCDSCAHLKEVHIPGGCFGGPSTNCDCFGFVEYKQ